LPTNLRRAFHHGELVFHGQLQPLAQKHNFTALLNRIVRSEWVVYAKPPFGGPQQVLKYLARYTHRVAIANQRLVALQDGQGSFRCKDYTHAGRPSIMTLQATEFIRRFLLHALPRGFVKIRHFGFLANRGREDNIRYAAHCWTRSHPTSATPRLPGKSNPTHPIAVRCVIKEACGRSR
jgi:hypothetical protein